MVSIVKMDYLDWTGLPIIIIIIIIYYLWISQNKISQNKIQGTQNKIQLIWAEFYFEYLEFYFEYLGFKSRRKLSTLDSSPEESYIHLGWILFWVPWIYLSSGLGYNFLLDLNIWTLWTEFLIKVYLGDINSDWTSLLSSLNLSSLNLSSLNLASLNYNLLTGLSGVTFIWTIFPTRVH